MLWGFEYRAAGVSVLLPNCTCAGSLVLVYCNVLHCHWLAIIEMSVGKCCLRKKRLEKEVGQNETEGKAEGDEEGRDKETDCVGQAKSFLL